MELPTFKNDPVPAFAEFIDSEFPELAQQITTPKKAEELPLTVRMAYENWKGGKAFQNHFGNSGLGSTPLPVAVEMRRRNGTLEPQDAAALRAAGLEHFAQEAEKLGDQVIDQRIENQTQQSRKEFFAQRELYENSPKFPTLTPEQIARNKRTFGIS